MSKGIYLGSAAIAAKAKKMYLGVDGVARKIKKVYLGVDGVARLCYSGGPDVAGMSISYTGSMTDEIVTMSGVAYRLLTLLTSGTLSVPEAVNAEVWMCGGGTSGESPGGGGAGAFCTSLSRAISGNLTAVVGAGGGGTTSGIAKGGKTAFDQDSTSVNFVEGHYCVSGGTGGGRYNNNSGAATGDGISKIPFGDSTYYTHPHCAGGGGGGYSSGEKGGTIIGRVGTPGGTNGGNSGAVNSSATISSRSKAYGGTGGDYGGGAGDTGGLNSRPSEKSGAYYGAAGGGGGMADYWDSEESWSDDSKGGAGYQGVIYVRIPIEQ